jgi:hypothetical protein
MIRVLTTHFAAFFCICLLAFAGTESHLSGSWSTPEKPGGSFTLFLTQTGDAVTGYHTAIAHHGNRIDATLAEDGTPSIKGTFSNGVAHVTFKSGYSDVTGEAEIVLQDDKLAWTILRKSSGSCYIPDKAFLQRDDSK